jgi:drug/metabolite transporter (DMT)-like permease
MLPDERVGTLSAIVVSVIWGLSFVAARVVLITISPVLLATVRFVIASAIFTAVIIRERNRGTTLDSRDLVELAFLGFLSISIYFWLQYTGVQLAGAGISALLVVGLIPIVTGLFSSLIMRERFTLLKVVGTSLGLLGVSLITVPGLLVETVDYRFYIGVASLLGNTICFALYSTLSRRLMQRIEKPALVTAYITVFGTMALIPMSLTSDWGLVWELVPKQWASIFFLALVCSVCGYLLWNYALSKLETMKAAVWLYLEPLAAFIGEALLFGIVPSPTTLLGGGVILLGAFLTSQAGE